MIILNREKIDRVTGECKKCAYSMTCQFCSQFTDNPCNHDSQRCPFSTSMYCRRCQSYGHLVSQCDAKWEHWERPASVEELIPYHIRMKYGIKTVTPIEYVEERGATEETFQELPLEVVVPGDDKKMRKFMEDKKIKRAHKGSENLQAIREWAIERGLRIRIENS